ncbi:MAG: hypothetical protein QOF45_1396 [Gaiellaceae bacterium]|jgi:hypothetical protein|nr:hypothetical protein [Gaiellaceae bacterium]
MRRDREGVDADPRGPRTPDGNLDLARGGTARCESHASDPGVQEVAWLRRDPLDLRNACRATSTADAHASSARRSNQPKR